MKKSKGNSYTLRGPGRPEKPDVKINASAEKIAQRIFANAKPASPSRRQKRNK